MPSEVMSRASAPFQASSAPTCGPTNSTRLSVAVLSSVVSPSITALDRSALFWPGFRGMRISTSREDPKFCTE